MRARVCRSELRENISDATVSEVTEKLNPPAAGIALFADPISLMSLSLCVSPAFLFVVLIPNASLAQGDLSKNPVYSAFSEYKHAILQGDAETAFQSVDSRTVRYYADALDHALNMDEQQARGLRMIDLLMVLTIRHRISPEDVKKMDAEALFKHGVASGWIGKESVAGIDILDIDLNGHEATAKMASNGREVPVAFRFSKEGGRWKIDLTSVMDVSSSAFSKLAEQQGLSETDLLFLLLETVSGRQIDPDSIWEPINRQWN